MSGILVLVSAIFLLKREPAIDAMEKQGVKLGFWQEVWEAVTAQSHRRVPEPVREAIAAKDGRGERVIG